MKLEGPILKEGISYYGAFDQARQYYEEDFIQESKKYRVLPREEYFVKDVEQKVEAEGVKRLKRFEDILFNKFKYKA
jgi:shikimate kinase